MRNYTILFLFYFSMYIDAQTFRETVLYCDGIAIGNSKIINGKKEFLNDFQLKQNDKTEYTITDWIKRPEKAPSTIKNKIESTFFETVQCGLEIRYDSETKIYELFYIKKINHDWKVLKSEVIEEKDLENFKQNVKIIENISKLKNEEEKYYAYIDWVLDDSNKNISNLKNIYRDLDSTSIFMQYFKTKGINGLNNSQKLKLKNQIIKDIYDSKGCGGFFEEDLIYLVYQDYKKEIDEALLKRLKCYFEVQKKRNVEENLPSYNYEIQETLETFYSINKNNLLINDLVMKIKNYQIVNDEEILKKIEEILISTEKK